MVRFAFRLQILSCYQVTSGPALAGVSAGTAVAGPPNEERRQKTRFRPRHPDNTSNNQGSTLTEGILTIPRPRPLLVSPVSPDMPHARTGVTSRGTGRGNLGAAADKEAVASERRRGAKRLEGNHNQMGASHLCICNMPALMENLSDPTSAARFLARTALVMSSSSMARQPSVLGNVGMQTARGASRPPLDHPVQWLFFRSPWTKQEKATKRMTLEKSVCACACACVSSDAENPPAKRRWLTMLSSIALSSSVVCEDAPPWAETPGAEPM